MRIGVRIASIVVVNTYTRDTRACESMRVKTPTSCRHTRFTGACRVAWTGCRPACQLDMSVDMSVNMRRPVTIGKVRANVQRLRVSFRSDPGRVVG